MDTESRSWNPWEWSQHTLDVLTALGTAGAVVVVLVIALLGWMGRAFISWLRRPRLKRTFDRATNITSEGVSYDGGKTIHRAAYVRLAVSNEHGARAAQGVEVVLRSVETLALEDPNEEDEWGTRHNLGPLPWTHSTPPELTLAPGSLRTVDFGYALEDGTIQNNFTIPLPSDPFSRIHVLAPGSYRIRLTVTASNIRAQDYEISISWDGAWSGDPPLGKHLQVTTPAKL